LALIKRYFTRYERTKNYTTTKRYFPAHQGEKKDTAGKGRKNQKSAGQETGTLTEQIIYI
jgi:hypothetical protein